MYLAEQAIPSFLFFIHMVYPWVPRPRLVFLVLFIAQSFDESRYSYYITTCIHLFCLSSLPKDSKCFTVWISDDMYFGALLLILCFAGVSTEKCKPKVEYYDRGMGHCWPCANLCGRGPAAASQCASQCAGKIFLHLSVFPTGLHIFIYCCMYSFRGWDKSFEINFW